MKKVALITGVTGQDGAYLSELLLKKGYEVHGIKRRSSLFNTDRIDHLYTDLHEENVNFFLHYGDMTDSTNLIRIVQEVQPDVYPRSPYAVAKLYGFWITKNYREAYNMYACNGILFNHESPLRGETFVTRKITRGVARIKLGMQKTIYLGNIDAKRDWGHAKDYVEGMWLMLQQDKPEDFVLATGITTSVRDFITIAFKEVGINVTWEGKEINEVGKDEKGNVLVKIDPKYFRPTEVELLIGDASKANNILGWKPKYDLKSLIKDMVNADLKLFERDKYLMDGGHKILNYKE